MRYPVHATTLDNGLRVVVSPDPYFPVVAVSIWYDVGSRDEAAGQAGWAHLLEHLMFQGSANVAPGEHLNSLQRIGGSVNATTSFDRTNYSEIVPTGALDLALWLEADRLSSLGDHLDQTKLDTQRRVVIEEKRQRYDNVPYGHATQHLLELTFPADHPYSHVAIGRDADLGGATLEGARDFFTLHYRPENAVLTLVGDITARDGFKRVEKAFGWIPGGQLRPRRTTRALPPLAGRPRRDIAGATPAAAVYLAWRLPTRDTPEFDAATLALTILSNGQTSRLRHGLVNNRALASSVSAGAVGLIAGTSFAAASAHALSGTHPDDLAAALEAETDRLAATGPTPGELARAQAGCEQRWLSELAQLGARADQFSAYATLHDDPDRVNRRLAELRTITIEDVGRAAANLLTVERSAVLHYTREAT